MIKSAYPEIHNSRISAFKAINDNTPDSKNSVLLIAPGFINLHCHLAYTDLQLARAPLFSWLKNLMAKKINFAEASLAAAKKSLSFGTTFLVDNTSHIEESINAFQKSNLKGLIGLEVFGSDPQKAQSIFDQQIKKISELEKKHPDLDFCLSPHASYDVSVELWHKCLRWSSETGKALLTHIAESPEEESWFQNQEAPLASQFWQELGTLEAKIQNWQSYKSSIDFMNQNAFLDYEPNPLIYTHAVQAGLDDLKIIKEKNIPLISCPRSNEFLENGAPDIKSWQELEISYGIGTDSEASNQDLDLRKEVNKLSEIYPLSAKEKFELLTTKAAQILGKEKEIGTLDLGSSADFTVFEINKDIDINSCDPLELIFDTDISKVKEVYINGKEVYQAKEKVT